MRQPLADWLTRIKKIIDSNYLLEYASVKQNFCPDETAMPEAANSSKKITERLRAWREDGEREALDALLPLVYLRFWFDSILQSQR